MDFWPNGGHIPMPGTENSWHAGGMSHFRATVRVNIAISIKLFPWIRMDAYYAHVFLVQKHFDLFSGIFH